MRPGLRITDITGVTPGGTAVATLTPGPRYFQAKFLTYLDGVLAPVSDVVDRVRVKVSGKIVWDVTADRLLKRNAVDNATPILGELALNFVNPGRADKQDEVFTAFDTNGESSFEIELTIKSVVGVPRITGTYAADAGAWIVNGVRKKNIIKLQELSDSLIAGQYDFTKIPTGRPIQRVFLDTTAAISLVEVDADGSRVHEFTKIENDRYLADYGLDGSQFAYVYAPDYTEQILDHLTVQKTLNMRITAGASAPVTALIETLGAGYV